MDAIFVSTQNVISMISKPLTAPFSVCICLFKLNTLENENRLSVPSYLILSKQTGKWILEYEFQMLKYSGFLFKKY